jgi:hypothetical protein
MQSIRSYVLRSTAVAGGWGSVVSNLYVGLSSSDGLYVELGVAGGRGTSQFSLYVAIHL